MAIHETEVEAKDSVGTFSPDGTFRLSPRKQAFFEAFGFMVLPGLFADDIAEISAAFDEVMATEDPMILPPGNSYHYTRDSAYQDRPRTIVAGLLDKHDRLRQLRTDPRVTGIATALLGDDYEYAESDGNLFNCDVYWHLDAYQAPIERYHIKLYFYLDHLTRSTGALRVIPGTHILHSDYADELRRDLNDPARVPEIFGVSLDEVPSWTLEVEPGDLVVGNFRTLHASFGGGVGRRLFTVNFREHTEPAESA